MSQLGLRKHLRVAWRMPCTLEVERRGPAVAASTYDLSAGGALVFSSLGLAEGERVILRLTPATRAGTKHLTLPGRVVRGMRDEDGILAIEFEALGARELDEVREVVFARAWSQMLVLGEFPPFWELGDLDLLTLASVCHEHTLATGTSLPREGDAQRCAYLVRSGSVQVRGVGGGASEGYEVLGPGSVFGESALLLGTVHGLDVVALEPSCLVVVPRAAMVHLREQDPRLALVLCEVFAREVSRRAARAFAPRTE